MAELSANVLDAAARAARATRADAGAVLQFLGTTRDHHEGRRVLRLEYEAYAPMALAALAAIERDAVARFAILSCDIVHRLGEVPPGEASVVVTVASAHRGPAFDACRWAMDRLKADVPVWKKEHFEGGDAAWAQGRPLDSA